MTAMIDDAAAPAIAPLYRLQYEPAQSSWVLLYPEGLVRLNGPAGEVLRRCDGRLSVRALIEALETACGGAAAVPQLRADVLHFLADAHGRGWIR